jgi:hypothetical protein
LSHSTESNSEISDLEVLVGGNFIDKDLKMKKRSVSKWKIRAIFDLSFEVLMKYLTNVFLRAVLLQLDRAK